MAAYANTQIALANDPIADALNPDNVTYVFPFGLEQEQANWNAQRGCFDGMTLADLEELGRWLDAVV